MQGDPIIYLPFGIGQWQKPLVAPIALSQKVGDLKVTIDGREIAAAPVIALEKIESAGVFGRAVDTVRLWFAKT